MGLDCVGDFPGMVGGNLRRGRLESPAGATGIAFGVSSSGRADNATRRPRRADGTEQEKQKAGYLISGLELQVGQIFPRDRGNASLIAEMIQTLNGLRSLLGLIRPH